MTRTNPEQHNAVEDEPAAPKPRKPKLTAAREAAHQPKTISSRTDVHMEDHDPSRVRTRRRNSTINEDIFFLPVDEIPADLSYEWKRYSNVGEVNPFYIAQMREQGWEPVPPSRHPSWVPPGYKEPHIIKSGLILMDRPIELTKEAQREQRQLAVRQIREAEQRLGRTPEGQLSRDADERVKPRITKEWNRPIPIEEN
jgi:hypothetical protein